MRQTLLPRSFKDLLPFVIVQRCPLCGLLVLADEICHDALERESCLRVVGPEEALVKAINLLREIDPALAITPLQTSAKNLTVDNG